MVPRLLEVRDLRSDEKVELYCLSQSRTVLPVAPSVEPLLLLVAWFAFAVHVAMSRIGTLNLM
jgi:hypothetical protein